MFRRLGSRGIHILLEHGILREILALFSDSKGALSITQPGPEVIKLFSCTTQLNMKTFLLINVKMPTIVAF